jgi:hypothetical protein
MHPSPSTRPGPDCRGRLARAVRLWREVTDAPLPHLDPSDASDRLTALELTLVEVVVAGADARRAADAQFQLAELSEGRASDDPVRRRVESVLPELKRLDERRSGVARLGDARRRASGEGGSRDPLSTGGDAAPKPLVMSEGPRVGRRGPRP